MVSRRHVLIGGGIQLGAVALAGCMDAEFTVGDDDDTDATGDNDTDETHAFSVDRFVYTTDRVEEYGEYSIQPNETYGDREQIWIYLELANVTPVASGPHLETTWEVAGPDGAKLVSSDESPRIPEEQLDDLPNEAFVTQGIDTSAIDMPGSGEYTTTVTLTDVGSGQTDTVSRPFTFERFEFETVVFTDGEPDWPDDYEEAADSTYTVGDPVWILVTVQNVPTDSSGTATLQYTFEVETPDGQTWDPVHERTETWSRVGGDEILMIGQRFETFEDDTPGTYEMTITVKDQQEGRRLQTTEQFVLERTG